METQISSLLSLTYSGSNDEEIKNAENELFESMQYTDFIPSLFNIILNPSNDIQLRKSAILFLNNSIRMLWNQENSPLDEQVKQNIFLFIPQLLKISTQDLIQTCSHLSTDVIYRVYLTNEWQELYNEIINGFSSQPSDDEDPILCSLILSDSLLSVSILINKENGNNENESFTIANQNLIQFISEQLLQFILSLLQEKSSNLQYLIYCYQLINHIFKFNERMTEQIISLNSNLMLISQEMVQNSLNIKEVPSDNPFFELFFKKIMKFLTTCALNPHLSSLINIDYISSFLPIIQEIFKSDMSNSVKCSALQFLKEIFSIDTVWQSVGESDVAKTLIDIVSPLFSVSPIDFEMAYNDPSGFISENQKICEDFNDLKATSSLILSNSALKHEVLLSFCLSNIGEVYQMFENGQTDQLNLFATFHMCSSVINLAVAKDNDAVISLFGNMSSLFQISQDENFQLANAAIFMLLAQCTSLEYSKELVQVVFANIDNPFDLTRYFAVECISSILRQLTGNPKLESMKDEIFNEYGDKLEQSLQLLLSISKDVSNEYLTESFTHLFEHFGERLLPFAQDITENFLSMIHDLTSSGNSGDDLEKISTLIAIINSFSTLIKIIIKSEEASNQLLPNIYDYLLQLLPNIPTTVISTYFSLFDQIVIECPFFSNTFWNAANYFNSEYSTEFNQLLELIQFKEVEMQSDESAIQIMLSFISGALDEINDYDEFQSYCPPITGFVLRMGSNILEMNDGAVFSSIVQKIVPFIQFLSSEDSEKDPEISNNNIVRLLNALMIVDTQLSSFLQICGDDFSQIFSYWENRLIYPLSVPVVFNVIQLTFLEDEQKAVLLSNVVDLMYRNLNKKADLIDFENGGDDDDEYDDLDDIDGIENTAGNCPWYADMEVVSMFNQLLASNRQNEALFEKCNENEIQYLIEYQKNQFS